MSGRGKGGKGLGAAARKRAKLEPYEWTPNERVAVVSYANYGNREVNSWVVPVGKLHQYVRAALLRIEKSSDTMPSNVELCINLSDEGDNEGLFEYLKASDLRSDDEDEDEDDEDDEIEDRSDVLEEIGTWVQYSLPNWKGMPLVPVCVGVKLSLFEE
jgi:hypothetical protein